MSRLFISMLVAVSLMALFMSAVPSRGFAAADQPYAKGSISADFMIGPLFSPISGSDDKPVLNFVQADCRLAWQLTDPDWTDSWYGGSLEAGLEVTAASVYKGFADVIVGAGPFLRYTFIRPGWRILPYVQAGIDVIYSDAHQDHDQDAMGSAISFQDHVGLGLRYLVSRNWAISLEGRLQHMSNAGLDDRNDGVNSFGGLIGVTYYFDTL